MQAQRIRAQHNERIVLAHGILGRTIEDLRTARAMTRRELATATHSNPRYIGALESGRINPPFHVLLRLIHPLGVRWATCSPSTRATTMRTRHGRLSPRRRGRRQPASPPPAVLAPSAACDVQVLTAFDHETVLCLERE
ncbi:MAG TPA: helix-turn-helix transcriptional regulator [Conexibacter sp.]|nr:helix-turn-helix transcriptional regulator [Conexibacter sp.]